MTAPKYFSEYLLRSTRKYANIGTTTRKSRRGQLPLRLEPDQKGWFYIEYSWKAESSM
ncbi:hypothetical protein NX023_22100 [Cytobacillus firmus]|nr:hypothetical protein [Cytobacillus firmus]